MELELKFVGLDELEKAMSILPEKTKDAFLKKVNRELANKYIISRLKSLPYSSNVKKNIKIQTPKRSKDKTAIIAGPTSAVYWLKWVELGTKQRETRSGADRGSIAPQNKIGPVIDSQIQPIINDWAKNVGDMIMNVIDKNIKAGHRKLARLG